MMMAYFLSYLNLLTAALGLIFILVIGIKLPMSKGTKLAVAMVFIMSLRSLVYFSFQVDWFPSMFRILPVSGSLQFLVPYFLYIYIRWISNPTVALDFRWFHWVLPVFVLLGMGFPTLFFMDAHPKDMAYDDTFKTVKGLLPVKIYFLLWILQTGVYMGKIIVLLHRLALKVKDGMELRDRILPLFFIFGSFFAIFLMYTGTFISTWVYGGAQVWLHVSSVFKPIFFIGLFGFCYRYPVLLKPQIRLFEAEDTNAEEEELWRSTPLSGVNVQYPHLRYEDAHLVRALIKAMEDMIEREKPFRDPGFDINDLSNKLNLPMAHLRFVFKEFCGLTFNDYRNFCRVKDLETVLVNSTFKHLTIEAMGEICGFGSKSAMFRAVRRHYDLTPQELQFRLLTETAI
jgi:AraC-like DNA-binding protein